MIEILARPKRAALEALQSRPEVAAVESFGERLHATLTGEASAHAEETAERLAAELRAVGIEVETSRPVAASLEDLFIARIQSESAAVARSEVRA